MNFKDFFILQERRHFISLSRLTYIIISQLEEKIKKKKNGVRAGSTFKIKIDADHTLAIKFYKGYSRRTLDDIKANPNLKERDIGAVYFPVEHGDTESSIGTIEIYLNPNKQGHHYYKDKKFEDIINSTLPKFIKEMIAHEVSHAYEDIIRQLEPTRGKNPDTMSEKEYNNLDEELNANLSAFLTSELEYNKSIIYKITTGDITGAVSALIAQVKRQPFMELITAENKIWVLKTIYTFVTELVDDNKETLPD